MDESQSSDTLALYCLVSEDLIESLDPTSIATDNAGTPVIIVTVEAVEKAENMLVIVTDTVRVVSVVELK